MVGHDDMSIETDQQALRSEPDACAFQPVHFTDQNSGVDYDPVSDHADFAGMEDP